MTVISLISASVEPVTVLVSLLSLTWLNKGQIKTTSWMFLEDSVGLFFFFILVSVNVSQPSLSLCLSTNQGAGVVHSREVINATPSFATSWHEASSGGRCRRVLPPLCGARGNQQQITSSSNEARCHPFSPPLPSHHQSGGGWGGEGRMRGGGEAAGYGGEGKCRARPIIP